MERTTTMLVEKGLYPQQYRLKSIGLLARDLGWIGKE